MSSLVDKELLIDFCNGIIKQAAKKRVEKLKENLINGGISSDFMDGLASGTIANFETLIEWLESGQFDADIEGVI